ncbi:hypothetical protein [Bacillus taeanensis]|uniref:Uncharacterized protein n=1 Tax=Bacillus taeanensis TaxID=273032 RepID=A0A366XS16_9BACI|nr:hypothetical protein [Bacillus taeanensis]RBW68922.1 hypothetical protein DS031_14400 [Bacillus taeanensis]
MDLKKLNIELNKRNEKVIASHGEVSTFNMFDLSWEEVQKRGFDKYMSKETFMKKKEAQKELTAV